MKRSDLVGRRDRLVGLLQPLLGRRCAQERASDIVQVLLFGDETPAEVACRILSRDLNPEDARAAASCVEHAWGAAESARENGALASGAAGALASGAAGALASGAAGAPAQPILSLPLGRRPRRARRRSVIRGLWN